MVAITYPIHPRTAKMARTATKAVISRTVTEYLFTGGINIRLPYTITPMIAPTTSAAPIALSRAKELVDRNSQFCYLCFAF